MSVNPEHYDVAVVGAGVVGLGTAWAAHKLGLRTLLVERSPFAQGASIRNFGMLWPIGQPSGELRDLAMRSRELWLQLASSSGLWLEECGSLHLAHQADEWELLQEFMSLPEQMDFGLTLVSPAEVSRRTKCAAKQGLLGGLFSPHECRVAPRQAIASFAEFLSSVGVAVHFGQTVTKIVDGKLETTRGESWQAEQLFICSGADFEHLYPREHAEAGLSKSKLHMLRTAPIPEQISLGPHLASGLTLRHYETFRCCRSQAALRERIAADLPELDRFGIHVMVSQDLEGRLILGDSHEYDDDIDPFNSALIDDLIIRELRKVFDLPSWDIDARWTGVYAKNPHGAWYEGNPQPGVTIINGLGGAGMTLSLAVTERIVHQRCT